MATAKRTGVAMPGWAPTTTHYGTDDGRFFAVTVDDHNDGFVDVLNQALQSVGPDEVDLTGMIVVPRDTTVHYADVDGHPVDVDGDHVPDLEAIWTFPPRTSADDAMRQAGYTIEGTGNG